MLLSQRAGKRFSVSWIENGAHAAAPTARPSRPVLQRGDTRLNPLA
jgi:hypothetical protein